MPVIQDRVFVAGGNDRLCSLNNAELVRYIGTAWNVLRIGALVAVGTDGVSNITGTLGMGVCSGDTLPLGNASTTLFCGARVRHDVPTLTYVANAGFPYFSTGSFYGLRKVAGVNTYVGVGSTSQFFTTNTGSLQRRSLIYVDLARAGTVDAYCTPTANMATDWTFSNFLEGLEYPTAPVVQNVTLTAITQQSVSFLETGGVLDHVDLLWTGVNQSLEVYAWGVWRRS